MPMSNRLNLYKTVNNEKDLIMTSLNKMKLKTTEKYTVTQITQRRLDLISWKFYQSFDFGWLIAEHNNIMDPFEEVIVGKVLNIPSLTDYFRFYNRSVMVRS
jgi:hypothetical protein